MTYLFRAGSLILKRKAGSLLLLSGPLVKRGPLSKCGGRHKLGFAANWITKHWLPKGWAGAGQEEVSMAWKMGVEILQPAFKSSPPYISLCLGQMTPPWIFHVISGGEREDPVDR